jgi:hypothetical protein
MMGGRGREAAPSALFDARVTGVVRGRFVF